MIPESWKVTGIREGRDELTCIVCPIGCRLKVEEQPDGSVAVSGNRCPRGAKYAQEEFTAPRRTVTGTCAIRGGMYPRVPVRTSVDVPVERMRDVLVAMYKLRLEAPIDRGTVVAEGVGGTDADLVTTMTVGRNPAGG